MPLPAAVPEALRPRLHLHGPRRGRRAGRAVAAGDDHRQRPRRPTTPPGLPELASSARTPTVHAAGLRRARGLPDHDHRPRAAGDRTTTSAPSSSRTWSWTCAASSSQHVQRLSLTFHDERFTGQLMSLINIQASSVGEVVMAFPPIAQNLLTLIGMLTIALLIDWQVTLISLVAVPFIYYAIGALRHPHRAAHPAGDGPRVALALDRLRGDVDAARDRLLRAREVRAPALPRPGPDRGRRAREADRHARRCSRSASTAATALGTGARARLRRLARAPAARSRSAS